MTFFRWSSFFNLIITLLFSQISVAYHETPPNKSQYYELRIYKFKTPEQKGIVDTYLRTAAIPALNRQGIANVGVFDEADQKDGLKLYVFIPYNSLEQFIDVSAKMVKELTSPAYGLAASSYLNTPNDKPAYDRIESTLMQSFNAFPTLRVPTSKAPKASRVYELRTYESATEAKGLKNIEVFNKYFINLFEKLGFNAAFYGQNLIGSQLPSLTYLVTYDSKESKDEHWKTFIADPDFKRIREMADYSGTSSKTVTHFLTPTEYSQL